MDPVYFAGDRWMSSPLFFFFSSPLFKLSKDVLFSGKSSKARILSMDEMWDMVPVSSVGTYVAQFGNSAIGEAECQTCVSKSPLSWLCDLQSLFCWELLDLEPESLQWAAEGLQDLARHLHLLPPESSLCSSRCDLVVLQLNLACSHLRAFPLPVPFASQALSSLRPSSVSPKCQMTFSRGLPVLGTLPVPPGLAFSVPALRFFINLLHKFINLGTYFHAVSPLCKQGFHLFSSELCFGE